MAEAAPSNRPHMETMKYEHTDDTYDDQTRKSPIALDNAAFSTYHPHPHPLHSIIKLQRPSTTITANSGTTPVTHSGALQVQATNYRILIIAVVTPRIPETLLSIRSITGRHRSIVFTQDHAYTLLQAHIEDLIAHLTPLST